MHEEIDDKFDLFVRSVMEDAEEEVPAGIWDSIESRLPRKSPAIVWWKRLGFAVAACAAVISAFVLTGISDRSENVSIVSPVDDRTVAQIVPAPAASLVKDDERGVSSQISDKTTESDITDAGQPGSILSPDAVQSENIQNECEDKGSNSEEVVSIEPSVKPAGHPGKQTYEQEWNDYLAQESKAGHSAGRISAEFLGSFGSNDNISNRRQSVEWMGAPTILGNANTGIIESGESFYSIPVTFGVGARYYFTEKFSAGAGINFSILTRSFTGTYQKAVDGTVTDRIPNADVTHKMLYLGIPVNLYYDILQTNLMRFYAFAGGAAEKCLSNKYKVIGDAGEASLSEDVRGLQWSAALGLGIQFNLSEHTGLYLDPNARYYFDCKQPKSIRTQKPFMFNIEAGIRFNL